MADTSKIEWTDATWNVVTGCEKVSPGCDNCYAETFAERWRGTPGHHFENGFDITLRPERLTLPLRWRKPKRVFVNSMSDLFHKDIPDEYIARTFAVMALTPQHTYQVLTKRHGRMRSVLTDTCTCGNGHVSGVHFRSAMAWAVSKANPDRIPGVPDDAEQRVYNAPWPLSNVWLGVSVEDQKRAGLRIPALVETPAAVRFLSCEPLLGPVDLTSWMPPVSPVPAAEAPRTWADWAWPDWVPAEVRKHVEGFWGADQGRTPRDWIRDMHQQGAPAFGSTVTLGDGFGPNAPKVTGRFVHAWNNIARLVRDDGTFAYTSFHHALERKRQQPINWVIVGGESGRGARPMAPQWATSLRDQCTAADVPFFFKQWGEYAPTGYLVIGGTSKGALLAGDPVDDLGHRVELARVGKKNAGRELDGRTHDAFPVAVTR
jgi:protein gp37